MPLSCSFVINVAWKVVAMVQDLLALAKMLQYELRQPNSLMEKFLPTFTLIGSVAEGTRIGIANELDLTVEFEGFEKPPFQVLDGDTLKCQKCRKNRAERKSVQPFEQCEKCVVTISQTKMGACLQYLWNKTYCSVDLVPTFKINTTTALNLARNVNTTMVKEKPEGWFGYLQKYASSDMIMPDWVSAGDQTKAFNSGV
jgi:hypothetical protein